MYGFFQECVSNLAMRNAVAGMWWQKRTTLTNYCFHYSEIQNCYAKQILKPPHLCIKVLGLLKVEKKYSKPNSKKITALKKVLKKGDAPFKVLKKLFYIFFVMLKKSELYWSQLTNIGGDIIPWLVSYPGRSRRSPAPPSGKLESIQFTFF